MVKNDKEILEEIKDAWENVKDDPVIELSPKAINWMLNKLNELL